MAFVPFRFQAGGFAEFRGADRRTVLRMTKQDASRLPEPLVEANAAFGAVLLEVRRDLSELNAHVESPF